jgi:hypothetical protein
MHKHRAASAEEPCDNGELKEMSSSNRLILDFVLDVPFSNRNTPCWYVGLLYFVISSSQS